MIVPSEALDELGQRAQASITFLRYSVTLATRHDDALRSLGSLELRKEELSHINIGDAYKHLLFPHDARQWRRTAVRGQRRTPYFISTEGDGQNRLIKLHQDSGGGGRPLSRSAAHLPRTVLSVTNAAESPTALLARREMQSWRLLQLEPSSLRRPDEFTAPTRLGVDGSHLPATLYHLAGLARSDRDNSHVSYVYGQVANRLSELIDDVHAVWVDRDERRELLTLQVTDRGGTSYPACALSDGTLRFLALAVLNIEPESSGVLCLEEPENGIHPERIPAMLQLLQDIATDAEEPISLDNPLRQVMINTHSPAVVSQVPDDSLLIAELQETERGGKLFKRVCFSGLPNTWRQKAESRAVSRGRLLSYLNPSIPASPDYYRPRRDRRRVMDRPDMQMMLPLSLAE